MHTVLGCLAVAAMVGAADAPALKQVMTFEKEECLKYAGYKEVKDDRLVIRYNAYGTYHYMGKGDATEGEWAIAKAYKTFAPLATGLSESGQAAVRRTGRLFNGFAWMRRRGLTGDWSAYDRLWMDVKSTDAPARIRVTVIDALTFPLPERRYEIPAGKWVTLEFNLADAADGSRLERLKARKGHALFARCLESALYPARVLDLKNVWSIFVNVERVDGPSTLMLDNVRLVPTGSVPKPTLPLLTDPSPWSAFQSLPIVTTPTAVRQTPPAGGVAEYRAAKETPTVIDLTGLRGVSYGRLHNDRCGIAVADANRMAITVAAGMNRCLFVTQDAGKTWADPDDRRGSSGLFRGNLMMVGATCTPAADGRDLLLTMLKHCAGGEEPSRVFFVKIPFNGRSWWPEPLRVIDADSWHCPEHTMDVLRLPNGRLWAAWTPITRTRGKATTARYSDDDGTTWRDLGANGVIGGRGRPLLVPYGDGVACFRTVGWQDYTVWSHTAGGTWTKPKRINIGTRIRAGVTVGEKTIFLAVGERKGGKLIRLDGDTWVAEQVPFAPIRLSRAGDRVIALDIKDKRTILMSTRSADGAWSPGTVLATEEVDLMDLAVPTRAPGGFLPIIWAPRNHKWVKFLRVPLP